MAGTPTIFISVENKATTIFKNSLIGMSNGIVTHMAIMRSSLTHWARADAQAERVGQYLNNRISMETQHRISTDIGCRKPGSHIAVHLVVMTQG